MKDLNIDPAYQKFIKDQRKHWEGIAAARARSGRWGKHYHRHLMKVFGFHIPKGLRVIEFGCGTGDLLASLKPSAGLGVDISVRMISLARESHPGLRFEVADALTYKSEEKFDLVIMSDLVNSLFDVQQMFEIACSMCAPGGRILLNYYSRIWQLPLKLAGTASLSKTLPEPNWLTPHDVRNLLYLAGAEPIKEWTEFLFPLRIPVVEPLFNRILARLFPGRLLCLSNFVSARPVPHPKPISGPDAPSVTVVIPARNEAGNVPDYFKRVPRMGSKTEIIIVEGNSTDDTYEAARKAVAENSDWDARLLKQTGKGKADAVRVGFNDAKNDILMILDADLTVVPEDLPRFYEALVSGKGEFINGVRLVYPLEGRAMRFLNLLGNKFFSYAFSWLLGQAIRDTLCGTKVMYRKDYDRLAASRSYFGDFDPFGDYDLIFGAAKMGLKLIDMPIRYRDRTYGDTNISRWRHGALLLRMVVFAARRIKFV